MRSTTRLYDVTRQPCLAEGFEPKVRSQRKDYGGVIALGEAGLAAAMLPGLAFVGHSSGIAIRPSQPALSRRILAAVRSSRPRTPAIASMLDLLLRPPATPIRRTWGAKSMLACGWTPSKAS